jgi:hypothetical protein
MSDEYVDVIDEKDRITGQAAKTTVHSQGLRHRVAASCCRERTANT